jgi:hypothetical protein
MASMALHTRVRCIGCAGVLSLAAFVGCAQTGQQTTRSAFSPVASTPSQSTSSANATTQQPTNVIAAATNVVTNAAGAVTGAVTGAVSGAVSGVNGAQAAQARRPRIKPDGRGGFDASELQADAIKRSHDMTAYYGAQDRARTAAAEARRRAAATQPTH